MKNLGQEQKNMAKTLVPQGFFRRVQIPFMLVVQ
jgi:hypothetical protein